MTQWTKTAQDALEDYLSRAGESIKGSGADADEVKEDLRRHVNQEIAAAGLQIITEEDVRRILARIGPAERPSIDPFPQRATPEQRTEPTESKWHSGLLFFGVALPVATIVIEVATHMCAGVFFDPIPTWWHVALASMVPVVNFVCWHTIRNRRQGSLKQLGWLSAFALAISGFYALLYLPLIPPALIAIVFFGWGLLPLAPLLSFIAGCSLRKHLRALASTTTQGRLTGLWPGLAGAAAALVLIALPPTLTHVLGHLATADSAETRTRAVKWLRAIGSKKVLLADCYGSTSWSRNSPLAFNFSGEPLPAEEARAIFFRVTGKPFNAVAPPQKNFSRGGWDWIDDFSWDDALGGDAVAGRVKGLSLSQSRLDGLFDADAAWSYVEWILEFKNSAPTAREARAQIGLPPGGVVSRLTLWVNGEEREAAFAGTAQTREAYKQVAVVQRRDPVLVTSCGIDRVLMQCFPVSANGGTMKVRLGITAPAIWARSNQVATVLPTFLERNFGVASDVKHSVWVESPQQLKSSTAALVAQAKAGDRFGIRGELRDTELGSAAGAIWAERSTQNDRAWVMDHATHDGAVIWQTVKREKGAMPERLVLVIDGSAGMEPFYSEIADALLRVPPSVEISIIQATDDVVAPITASASSVVPLAAAVRKFNAVGGQDNVEALVHAWDIASAKTNSVIVWIHGPQPVLVGSIEALKQRLVWRGSSSALALFDLQTRPGPNRVLEKVDALPACISIPRLGTLKEDLTQTFRRWGSEAGGLQIARERAVSTNVVVANLGKQSSKHLTRLWAYDEILRKIAAHNISEAVALAARYQLVTPVSGAVVLENAAQFARAGLTPVEASTVPSVPEPSTIVLLILFGAFVGVVCFYRRCRSRVQG